MINCAFLEPAWFVRPAWLCEKDFCHIKITFKIIVRLGLWDAFYGITKGVPLGDLQLVSNLGSSTIRLRLSV